MKNKYVVSGALIGGACLCGGTALLAGPVILPLLGFTSGGITAGSAAASAMSFVYTKGVGLAFLSAAQSAGAVGAVSTSTVVTSSTLGGAAGHFVKKLFRK